MEVGTNEGRQDVQAYLPVIDGYRIDRRLNAGGIASVYEGQRESDGQRVAIKVLSRDRSTSSYDRFVLEAQVGMKLDHPDIIRVLDYGESASALWIVMDLLDGVDLSVAQHDPELGFSARMDIVIRVARALQVAHSAQILHRDVKPSNIFIKADGGVCLLDFGISKVAGFDLTKSHVISGTPGYIAPEQIQGHAVDGRADLFSLAVVAYELLSGHPPWPRTTIYQAMLATCTQAPESLQQSLESSRRFDLTPPVRAQIHQVVHRTMATDPELRFAAATDFADALEAVLTLRNAGRPGSAPAVNETVSTWAPRRLEWAKARAERAIREQSVDPEPVEDIGRDNSPKTRQPFDFTIVIWALLMAGFIAGTVAALLGLVEV